MKKLFSVLAVLVALSMLFVGCTASQAQPNSVAAIKAKGELVVATNAEFPPFEYMDGDKIVGVDMDIAQAIADKLGVKLKIDNMAFEAVLAAVPSGKADLGIAGLSVDDPERQKVMDFSDNYISTSVVMVVAIDNETLKTKEDLVGKKIGVQLGTIADTEATGIKDAEVARMNKDADSIQDLMNGRLDAVLLDINPAQVFVKQNAEKIKLVEGSIRDDVYAAAAKKGNAELLKIVNEVIKGLKDSGQYDKILEKYNVVGK